MNIEPEILKRITCFVFDVDGVLTDGTVLALESGEQVRNFNIKDGYAIERALQAGYQVAIISGGKQVGVEKRLAFLKIKHVFLGVKNKVETFNEFCINNKIFAENVLYVGDDMPDFDVMQLVGLPCCPADAVQDIKNISLYISTNNGGNGCVRQIIEMVMHAQQNWHHSINYNINN